jgi:DNA-binding transcriptional ArsR family regulator
MRWSGPRHERTDRLPVAAVVTLALLLVANPAGLLLAPAGSGTGVADDARVAAGPCSEACALPGGVSVASIFPLGSDRRTPERSDPEVVGLTDARAGALFDALASDTARTVLGRLVEEPLTASELADDVDTSLQNVHYHLENLREAGAIAEIGVEYSTRGREMSVYTATRWPQVLVHDAPGDGHEADSNER